MNRTLCRLAVVVGMALALVLVAAGRTRAEDPKKAPAAPPVTVEKGDVNGDGKPDVWTYVRETPDPQQIGGTKRVVVKKEADLDFDGRKDITREYSDSGALTKEEADLDFDGDVDLVNLYKGGTLEEKHVYKGKHLFIRKYYKDGKMARMTRDDNDDGKADYCEVWYEGEKLAKRGWDKNGDGECDYWEPAY